ncbi:phage tail length tape measure family protein [Sphingopyxis sp. LARHCG72]
MTEVLGEAVLTLRTDDQGLDRGIDNSETKARRLGATFDRTTEQGLQTARAISQVGDAADASAGAMNREAVAAQASVPALRNHGMAVNTIADNSRKAAMQQKMLLFQLNDIGVSLAGGMNPLMVLVQQGSQIAQIYGDGEGGVGGALRDTGAMLGNFVKRFPLVTAATVGSAAAIGGMTYEINQLGKETVNYGDVALATWQVIADGLASFLKPAIDAVAPWFQSAWEMVVAGAKWTGNLIINSFRAAFEDIKFVWANFPDIIGAAVTGAVNLVIDGINFMVQASIAGVNKLIKGINSAVAAVGGEKALEFFGFSGAIPEMSAPTIGRVANPAAGRLSKAAEGRNKRVAEIMASDPLGEFFGAVSEQAQKNARKRKAKDDKDKKGGPQRPDQPDQAEDRYQRDLNTILLQSLAIRRNLATTIEERYRLERQALDIVNAQTRLELQNNDKFTAVQKAELLSKLAIRESLEKELLDRKEAEEKAREALQIEQALGDNQRDLLQKQLGLATIRQERREIEQQILESTYEELRHQLEATLASKTAADAAKADARDKLAKLDQNKALDQRRLDRDYESPRDRYRREVGDVGRSINDQMESIEVSGLQALNDGLTDVIMGARSLGDVFKEVANQIIADLLRIAVQQMIIMPLLNALGGGGGGATDGGLGGLFKGFFAHGGTIPTGSFGIVGERGPEPVISTPRGALVRPNSTLNSSAFRPAGGNVSIPISIDATGADPAALGRVQASVDRLRAELPGQIVRTVQDAGDRRLFTARSWS